MLNEVEVSNKIKNLSFLCSLAVVAIHCGWDEDSLMNSFFCEGVARIAVPFFFVVSGYFLARHIGEDGWYKQELRKRVASLLIPYFLWTIVSLLLIAPLSIFADCLAESLGRQFRW